MKFTLIILNTLLAVSLFSCDNNSGNQDRLPTDVVRNPISADSDKGSEDLPVMSFDKTVHDFGQVIQGEKISYSFPFTNTGKSALLISKVSASCGCTVADYPKELIKPGESAYIGITFDSEGRMGFQAKSVTVLSNAQPGMTELVVKANVVRP